MMTTRRVFMRGAALAMAGVGSAPWWMQRALYAGETRGKILLAIFQRGAADGLNVVVPHGEQRYYELRPGIAVPRPGAGEQAAIDLDGHFGLHPALAPIKAVWDEGRLAIVHAAGSPDPTRSHFDAQDYMESGTPGLKTTGDGWMNRALPAAPGAVSPVRAVAMGPVLPRALRGHQPALAMQALNAFQVRDPGAGEAMRKLYDQTSDTLLQGAGRETFEAMRLLESVRKRPYTPAAQYPRSRFGSSLQQIAQLVKADVGLEFGFVDIGGWDHHTNEPPQLTGVLRDFGQSLAAFWKDMGGRMADIVVVTMSEFGRTARENGNRGTDHGHANCMFVMGGAVRGGKVYGRWPGLAEEQLYERRDLALTTDFRDVLGEVVSSHLGNPGAAAVFPGYRPQYPGML